MLIDRMGHSSVVGASDGSLTVTVPIRIKRRGLRKTMTSAVGDSSKATLQAYAGAVGLADIDPFYRADRSQPCTAIDKFASSGCI